MRGLMVLVAVAMLAAAPAGSSGTGGASPKPTGRIAYAPRFYPKDDRIVDRNAGPSDALVVMRHDRRARRTVVRLRNQRLDDLAWSPDDRQLAFASGRGIRVVNTDGKGLHRVSRGRDESPTWSPDGKTIVFSRELRGFSHVLQMRANGTGYTAASRRAPSGRPCRLTAQRSHS